MFRIFATAILFCGAFGSPLLVLPQLDGRIVGGFPVEITRFPYQVSVQYFWNHICGGSIISSSVVLTAAHCTYGKLASTLNILAGSTYLDGSDGQLKSVASKIQHPLYNPQTIDYDISILKLVNNLTMGATVKSIPMTYQKPSQGSECVVSGWGALSEGGSSPNQLNAVFVPVVSNQQCNDDLGGITYTMFCAGFAAGGKDSCQGNYIVLNTSFNFNEQELFRQATAAAHLHLVKELMQSLLESFLGVMAAHVQMLPAFTQMWLSLEYGSAVICNLL